MNFYLRQGLRHLAVVGVLSIGSAFTSAPIHAQDPIDQQVGQYLASGEFAPALQMARQQPADVRDRLLAEIGAAQLQGGARDASALSFSMIHDDRVANHALDDAARAPLGGRGGAALADFDTLINLITSTINPDSWQDVGGPGAIESFPTGVYVDSNGLMQKVQPSQGRGELGMARASAVAERGNRDVHRQSQLRKVSLNRLERQLKMRRLFGNAADASMQYLAGLHKVNYVFFYPESGDIVLAGPADDWRTDADGRVVSATSAEPVLQLDDLVVLLRNAFDKEGRFGCAITPRKENLAEVQAFLAQSAQRPLKPGQRDRWLGELQKTLGVQDITVHGVDARTRVARVIVEADYHMKLVGMGIEDGTLGVTSYLDSIPAQGAPPAMSVLRWWFTLNPRGIECSEDRLAFGFHEHAVRVLSENEMLTETGQRVHTGQSEELNRQFAHSFTAHYADLCKKHPVYADMRNVVDLALVAALIKHHRVANEYGWHAEYFRDTDKYSVAQDEAPTEVASVINCRDLNRRQFIVGVSGGVAIDTARKMHDEKTWRPDSYGRVAATRGNARRPQLPSNVWWWD